jgi:hypothetical protein
MIPLSLNFTNKDHVVSVVDDDGVLGGADACCPDFLVADCCVFIIGRYLL